MSMKSPKVRLTGFLITVVLGATLIGITERRAWRQTEQLQERFEAMQQGGYHLADHLEASILRFNNSLLRFDLLGNPADREQFHADIAAFNHWLAGQRSNLGSGDERKLFQQIEETFANYLTHALQILEEIERTAGAGSPAAFLERTEKESKRLLLLAGKLADAQRESLRISLAEAHRSLSELKLLLAISLLLLIGLSLSLIVLVYRGMIAPLRIRLVESQALIERHEKLASLGLLAAGVAHEIRNPLTAIKARLFIQRKLLNGFSEPLEDNLFISGEISRLDKIIKDFLLFARPSEPQLGIVMARSIVGELVDLFQAELEKHSIKLKLEMLADPSVRADSQQIKQALINLIRNAAESIGHDGEIILRIRTRPATSRKRSTKMAVLEVQDNGPGIPAEIQKRLFDPFFTTKETGTGLGLSIAARIVQKHGGDLEYQTRPGRGTVFSIILPLSKNHEPEPSQNPVN